ncbi:MAG: NnrU family protein [Rhodospirillaceae bacterium]|nr:NnrU family protein [Rhodospirillaceae bacterium]
MTDLIITIAIFIVAHMLPAIGPLRRGIIKTIGKTPYIVGFSLMSLGLLGWVGIAYAEAPYRELWVLPGFILWLPALLMPLATILLVAVFTNPNPLSIALKSDGFNENKMGVVAITRHPLLVALLLWSVSHMVINGDMASVLLFGLFTIMSLGGPVSIEKRKKQKMSADQWQRLSAATSFMPFWAMVAGRARLNIATIGWPTIVAGLVLYGVLFYLHPEFIGAMPHP